MNEWKMTEEELDNAWQAGFPEYRDADVAIAAQKKLVSWLFERCTTSGHVGYGVGIRMECPGCRHEMRKEMGL